MSNLRNLKNRISALKAVGKITEASKMVAASEVRKYSKIMASDLNLGEIQRIFSLAMTSYYLRPGYLLDEKTKKFLGLRDRDNEKKSKLVIVIGSCKGLCGSFNNQLVNFAKQIKDPDVDFLVVGNNVRRLWTKSLPMLDYVPVDDGKRHHLDDWQDWLIDRLEVYDKFSEVSFLYHRYLSMVRQDVVLEKVLPLSPNLLTNEPLEVFDPGLEEVISNIAELCFIYKLNNVLIHKQLSEHTARMTAMEKASKNTKDLVEKLTTEYNKCRQAFITKEICEIIAGTIS